MADMVLATNWATVGTVTMAACAVGGVFAAVTGFIVHRFFIPWMRDEVVRPQTDPILRIVTHHLGENGETPRLCDRVEALEHAEVDVNAVADAIAVKVNRRIGRAFKEK